MGTVAITGTLQRAAKANLEPLERAAVTSCCMRANAPLGTMTNLGLDCDPADLWIVDPRTHGISRARRREKRDGLARGGSIHSTRTLSPRIPHTTICRWSAGYCVRLYVINVATSASLSEDVNSLHKSGLDASNCRSTG